MLPILLALFGGVVIAFLLIALLNRRSSDDKQKAGARFGWGKNRSNSHRDLDVGSAPPKAESASYRVGLGYVETDENDIVIDSSDDGLDGFDGDGGD
ncbi:hypothetical protein GCM10023155_41850 [Bremerella cremea]